MDKTKQQHESEDRHVGPVAAEESGATYSCTTCRKEFHGESWRLDHPYVALCRTCGALFPHALALLEPNPEAVLPKGGGTGDPQHQSSGSQSPQQPGPLDHVGKYSCVLCRKEFMGEDWRLRAPMMATCTLCMAGST